MALKHLENLKPKQATQEELFKIAIATLKGQLPYKTKDL